MQMHWTVTAHACAASREIERALELPAALAQVLVCRGYGTVAAARSFLNPSVAEMHDPLLMKGMSAAVSRLRQSIQAGEPILIYGDYDVDGTVATTLLKTAIERAAAMIGKTADVRYHIPHRIREGYGMQESRIEAAAAEGIRLIVSVDTGIRAFAAAEEARRLGLDLIVTDHHLADGVAGVPEAIAVVNPNQPGCPYPYKDLCGAAVAYKLAQALMESAAQDDIERKKLREKLLPSFMKLLAIATIADAVPLTGENRIIASVGLVELRKPTHAGLRALMELAKIDLDRSISATDVGFRLAPRINAAGRMDVAQDVVEMFLTRDTDTARAIAEKLHRLNDERRATEAEALRAIELQIAERNVESAQDGCLVLDDGDGKSGTWHRGVVGILASRVVDKTGKPALVMTHEDGTAYGSGRSVAGFHLLDALTEAHAQESDEPLFIRFGGHAHAVGFSLPSTRVGELRARLLRYAAERQTGDEVVEALHCDVEIRLCELTETFLTQSERLGPFGNGNPEPTFATYGVRLARPLKVVKERHLRLTFEDAKDGTEFSGMAWARRINWASEAEREGWAEGDTLDVAYRLRQNWHPDFGGWEMEIVGIRSSEPPTYGSPSAEFGCIQ
jgi:single-stranded-DNA-specific exonuclease